MSYNTSGGFPTNPLIQLYATKAAQIPETDEWLGRPAIPTIDELLKLKLHDMPGDGPDDANHVCSHFEVQDKDANIVQGCWPSKEEYLRAQYRLLRADSLLALSRTVRDFLDNPGMKEPDKASSVGIYDGVRIIGVTFTLRGVAFRIQFGLGRVGKQIPWKQSKRLISGSLVVLFSASDPRIRKVATVAARPQLLLERNPPECDLFFAEPTQIEVDSTQEWIMLENRSGYFEANKHVFKALQKMTQETLPLQDYVVNGKKEVAISGAVQQSPLFDLRTVFPQSTQTTTDEVLTDVTQEWPVQSSSTTLDESQLKALKSAITDDLCLIQGPPGCGKTHVSIQVMKILLDNFKPGDPPIIVTGQTNHALDQFLRLIAEHTTDFIRLGGRSKDTGIVQARGLREVRTAGIKSGLFEKNYLVGRHNRELDRIKAGMARLLQPMTTGCEIASLEILRDRGAITQAQLQSIKYTARNWKTDFPRNSPPLMRWLHRENLIEAHVRTQPQDFGFSALEEADPDIEEVEDAEAEQVVVIDEDNGTEFLRGHYISLGESWTGRPNLDIDSDQINRYLDQDDMSIVPLEARGAVYRVILSRFKEAILRDLIEAMQQYYQVMETRKIAMTEQDELTCRNQKVIGLTTARLSRDRALISSLQPRIVFIEEAGETLEAPVIAACVESLQQLILVGDHQQLRPHTDTHELARGRWNLGMSLFERLVGNGVSYSFLESQRRMKPGISRLLKPIYGDRIKDHPSVKDRARVPGMAGISTYFFHHTEPEALDENCSAYNLYEASMITGLIRYLIANGVLPTQVTILTFYNGQRKKLLRDLRADRSLSSVAQEIKVVTVDSYQGEQNDIVILSLVRSNQDGRLGFLDVLNRVCVALSRARDGFYLFGNSKLLSRNSEHWNDVITILRGNPNDPKTSRHGSTFPITCVKHARRLLISKPKDWDHTDGGCDLNCEDLLPCGHGCTLRCHTTSHKMVQCKQPCLAKLDCNHLCYRLCSQPCICNKCDQESDHDDDNGNGKSGVSLTGVYQPGKSGNMYASTQPNVARQSSQLQSGLNPTPSHPTVLKTAASQTPSGSKTRTIHRRYFADPSWNDQDKAKPFQEFAQAARTGQATQSAQDADRAILAQVMMRPPTHEQTSVVEIRPGVFKTTFRSTYPGHEVACGNSITPAPSANTDATSAAAPISGPSIVGHDTIIPVQTGSSDVRSGRESPTYPQTVIATVPDPFGRPEGQQTQRPSAYPQTVIATVPMPPRRFKGRPVRRLRTFPEHPRTLIATIPKDVTTPPPSDRDHSVGKHSAGGHSADENPKSATDFEIHPDLTGVFGLFGTSPPAK